MANKWLLRIVNAALATTVCLAAAHAAEKIRYEDIPARLGAFGTVLEHRGFKIVTLDGKEFRGRRLGVDTDHLRVFHGEKSWDDLPTDEVARIEISQGGRFFHHIADSAGIPVGFGVFLCGADSGAVWPTLCAIPVTAAFSPVWAYTAVTAPFYFASDAVAFFIPPRVYEIVH